MISLILYQVSLCVIIVSDQQLYKGIELYKNILENQHEWIDTEICIKLLRNISDAFNNEHKILQKIMIELTNKEVEQFQLLFLKIIPLKIIVK